MGGATRIYLRHKTEQNIDIQNEKLKLLGLAKKYRFYSEADIFAEWEAFLDNEGVFPEHLFPREKIKTYKDFKQFWHPDNVGTAWGIEIGALTFECYFERTKKKALEKIAKYVLENLSEIEKVSGSFSTFIEKTMTKKQKKFICQSHLKESI